MEKRKTNNLLIGLIAGLLLLSLIVSAINIMQYNQKKQEAEKLAAEKAILEEKIDEMRYRLDSPLDDDYIARVAREKLGLCYPDEIIYYNDLN
ncbi:MAG: septum formation initiator family protein [Clostridia bacterium]|nr:septum formation initiator family protein [Clostridia bacterium]